MALDILESIDTDTHQLYLYRYVISMGGKERQDASFKAWARGDSEHCQGLKRNFLARDDEKLWSKLWS